MKKQPFCIHVSVFNYFKFHHPNSCLNSKLTILNKIFECLKFYMNKKMRCSRNNSSLMSASAEIVIFNMNGMHSEDHYVANPTNSAGSVFAKLSGDISFCHYLRSRRNMVKLRTTVTTK